MWEDLADTLEPVSATKPMPVNVITGGGGGPVTVADGDDVAEGTTTDAAVTSDTNGTVIGFLRGLVKILASVWDSLNGRLKVDASAVAVPVTDNAGSLTVDGAVAATQSGTWTVQPGNTANTTAWKVDASSVAVPVTDNSGSLTVDDGGGSLTVDGPLTDAQLRAAVVPIGDGGGSLTVDGTVAVTDGGGSLTVDGPLTDTELRATPVPISGTVTITDGSGPVTVDGAVTVSGTATVSGTVSVDTITTSVTPGTGAAHLGKAEDAVHASGDTGIMPLSVRNDNQTSTYLGSANGDYQALQSDFLGNLRVTPGDLIDTVASQVSTLAQLAVPTGSSNFYCPGCSTVVVDVTGVWSGTLGFYVQGDGLTNVAVPAINLDTGVIATSTTANGVFLLPVGGYRLVKFKADALASGTISLNVRGSSGVSAVRLSAALPTGTNTIGSVTQGTSPWVVAETRPTSTTSVVDLLGATDATRVLTILAANSSRRGATIRNDTDTALMIREGGSASASNYTDILPAGARYTLDYPASTSILTAYLPQVPQGRLIATERS